MTEEEYEAALKEIETLMGADPDPESEEGKRLNALVDKVMEYEKLRWPMDVEDGVNLGSD